MPISKTIVAIIGCIIIAIATCASAYLMKKSSQPDYELFTLRMFKGGVIVSIDESPTKAEAFEFIIQKGDSLYQITVPKWAHNFYHEKDTI